MLTLCYVIPLLALWSHPSLFLSCLHLVQCELILHWPPKSALWRYHGPFILYQIFQRSLWLLTCSFISTWLHTPSNPLWTWTTYSYRTVEGLIEHHSFVIWPTAQALSSCSPSCTVSEAILHWPKALQYRGRKVTSIPEKVYSEHHGLLLCSGVWYPDNSN